MLWAGVPVLLFIRGMTLGKLLNFFEPPCAFKMGPWSQPLDRAGEWVTEDNIQYHRKVPQKM